MAKPCDCTADMATMQDGMCKIDQAAFIDAGAAVIDAGAIFIGARAVFTGARAAFNGARAAFIEARALLDMIEPTTDPQGTFANGGVLKASPKVPTYKAPHSAMETLRAEPGSLGCRGDDRLWGHPQAGRVKSPQARALADQKLCK